MTARTKQTRIAALLFSCLAWGGVATAAGDVELLEGTDGSLHLCAGNLEVMGFTPAVYDKAWKAWLSTAVETPPEAPVRFAIKTSLDGKDLVDGEVKLASHERQATATYTFSSKSSLSYNMLCLNADLGAGSWGGGTVEAETKEGKKTVTLPVVLAGQSVLGGEVRSIALTHPDGFSIRFSFPQWVNVGIQDNRRWGGSSFNVRFGKALGRLTTGEPDTFAVTIATPGGLTCRRDVPVTLAANDAWIPLKTELDIVKGSALDFSEFGFTDGPCGSKGRVMVDAQGHFVLAGDPQTPRRFYGVNLAYTANYHPKAETDVLLDRLVRLGYNTIRIHHHEIDLNGHKPGYNWDPVKVDQLDYLMAGCAKRGIWITTDLYISRQVSGKQVGLTGDTPMFMDKVKVNFLVSDGYFEDFKTFARKFLGRVNPYTGKTVAEDPTLAWISLVNEGPAANLWGVAHLAPEWIAAWNRWLLARYPEREDLETALGELEPGEDPKNGSVTLPTDIKGGSSRRSRLAQVFVAETEKAFMVKVRRFLREELKCQALLTDMNNAGPAVVALQDARAEYDYVDDHFYVDHPTFLEKPWRLPSGLPNNNPIREGATGASPRSTVRLFGKPFTVSEYQYAGPGRFRGVGGILTGAMGALQDWDILWRFAYSHKSNTSFEVSAIDYFNMDRDPLSQASDRAALLLFLRRDIKTAPNRVAVILPRDVLRKPKTPLSVAGTEWLAWITREGSAIVDREDQTPPGMVPIPLKISGDRMAVASLLRERKFDVGDEKGPVRSETGEIVIDKQSGVLVIDTPRSAGGYADAHARIDAPNAGVKIDAITLGATVFVSSLDANPIRRSSRLLVTHLTDLQNTGIRYAESARKTLLDWGGLPHLVNNGTATVHLALVEPGAYSVWGLSTGGRRVDKLETHAEGGELVFTIRVRGSEGATLYYEVAKR